ncbi:MAG: hypothetical protein R3F54_08010 [Alphaproteobacteria bacterium]
MNRWILLLPLAGFAACSSDVPPPADADVGSEAAAPVETVVLDDAGCADGVFCDGFEDGQAGQPPGGDWIVDTRGSPEIEVDDHRAYGGGKSIRFTAVGKEKAYIALKGAPIFPLADNVLYGRAMMYLEAAPETKVHWTVIEATGMAPDGSHQIEYRYGGQMPIEKGGIFVGNRMMASYETPKRDGLTTNRKSDCWQQADDRTVMPTGRWVCLAWAFDGRNNGMKLWQDGVALDDLTVDGAGQGCLYQHDDYPWQAPIFDRINLGWESYQQDGERSLWIDDVAIGDRPLACPVKG